MAFENRSRLCSPTPLRVLESAESCFPLLSYLTCPSHYTSTTAVFLSHFLNMPIFSSTYFHIPAMYSTSHLSWGSFQHLGTISNALPLKRHSLTNLFKLMLLPTHYSLSLSTVCLLSEAIVIKFLSVFVSPCSSWTLKG